MKKITSPEAWQTALAESIAKNVPLRESKAFLIERELKLLIDEVGPKNALCMVLIPFAKSESGKKLIKFRRLT
jgi:hypothetical protein